MPRENTTSTINQLSIQMAKIGEQIKNIEENVTRVEGVVNEVKKKLDGEYATREWCESKYGQTTKVVNGILGAIGIAIVGAFAAFVLKGGLN